MIDSEKRNEVGDPDSNKGQVLAQFYHWDNTEEEDIEEGVDDVKESQNGEVIVMCPSEMFLLQQDVEEESVLQNANDGDRRTENGQENKLLVQIGRPDGVAVYICRGISIWRSVGNILVGHSEKTTNVRLQQKLINFNKKV